MNVVLRSENKYLLNTENYIKNLSYLKQILKEDSHNQNSGYLVRSLYFDTLDDKDFWEKESGVEIRRKIRLRVYNPKDEFAFLEMKKKQGELQEKRSLKMAKKDAIELINGNYEVLLHYKEEFAKECFGIMSVFCYRPKCIVDYKRQAFVVKENNTRITFDSHIMATESSFNIFEEKLPMYPVLDQANVILEVKYNGFLLSYIKDVIKLCDQSKISVSKYCLARSVSRNYVF